MNKRRVAVMATAAVVVTSNVVNMNANLLDGMQLNVNPEIRVNQETGNKGPTVMESREDLYKEPVQEAVPEVVPEELPKDVVDNPNVKNPELKMGVEEIKNENTEEKKEEEQQNPDALSLPESNGDVVSGVDSIPGLNPLKVRPIDPKSNPATDNWLTQMVAAQAGTSVANLTQSHFNSITSLNIKGKGVSYLPQEHLNLFNLQTADLSDNAFGSIPDFRNSEALTTLDMSGNRLTEINMNASVTSLRDLDLSNNAIVSTGNLGSFLNIQNLNLANNGIHNVDDLATLHRLQDLNMANNQISNINPLRALNELTKVNLSFNRIIDSDPLNHTKTVTELYLSNNKLTDLDGLGDNHQNLVTLDFSNNSVSSIEPLKNCANLTKLVGDNNVINDIKPIVELTSLSTVSLDGNRIPDIEPLGKLGAVKSWSVQNQQLRLEPQKALNGDFKVHNPITYLTGDKIDPNYIDHNGKVNRNIISWPNMPADNTYFTTKFNNFSTRVDVPVNNWTNTPPIIEGADNVTFKIGDYPSWDPRVGIRVYDKEDGDLKSQLKISGQVNPNLEGIYVLTYSVTDSDGIESKVERRVEVVKNHKPVITTKDVTIKAGQPIDVMDGVKAMDYEDGDITIKVEHKGDLANPNSPGDRKIIYSVTDSDNNTTRTERSITVVRNSVPVLNGVVDKQIKIGTPFDTKAGISAYDAEDGEITSMIKIGGNVDTDTAGVYRLEYSVTDRDGNTARQERTIKVVSNYNPVIEGLSTVNIFEGEDFDPRAGVTAIDKEDGNLTSQIHIDGMIDTNREGRYVLTYKVRDREQNETKEIRTINVKSNRKPVISGVSDETIDIGTASYNPARGVVATDKEDGDLTDKIEIVGKVNTNKVGVYPITFKVKDKQNNLTVVTKDVTVVSNKPPVINGGGSNISNGSLVPKPVRPTGPIVNQNSASLAGGSTYVVIPEGSVFDPMSGINIADDNDANVQVSVTGNVNTDVPGDYQLVYKAVDSDGNVTLMNRVVSVRSNRAPEIRFTDNKVIPLNADFNPLKDIEVSDDHDKNLISKVKVDMGGYDITKEGVYQIVYHVMDSDGNEVKVPRTIIVRDNKSPIFHEVDDTEVEFDSKFDARKGVRVTDDKDKEEDLTRQFKVNGEVDTGKPGTYKLIYKVTDSEGLTSQHIRNITVKYPSTDKTPVGERPVINGATDAVVYQHSYFDVMQGVTAADRQDGDISKNLKIIGSTVNTDVPGIQIVIYEVSDSDGNTARATRAINVVTRPDGAEYQEKCNNCGKVHCNNSCKTCSPKTPCGTCSSCCPPKPSTSSNLPKAPISGTARLPKTGTMAPNIGIVSGIGAAFVSVLGFIGFKKKRR